jgi:ABC-type sugar transport system permease subunit
MSEVASLEYAESEKKEGAFRRLVNLVPLPVWFIVPVEAILLFLLITPSIMSIWLSVVNWMPTYGIGIFEAKFVGAKNFIGLFTEARFLWAFLRTFIVTGVCVSAQWSRPRHAGLQTRAPAKILYTDPDSPHDVSSPRGWQ